MSDSLRNYKMSLNLTRETGLRVEAIAERHRWTRSYAAAVLIERGLEAGIPEPEEPPAAGMPEPDPIPGTGLVTAHRPRRAA
jgi:hypothetical protein